MAEKEACSGIGLNMFGGKIVLGESACLGKYACMTLGGGTPTLAATSVHVGNGACIGDQVCHELDVSVAMPLVVPAGTTSLA